VITIYLVYVASGINEDDALGWFILAFILGLIYDITILNILWGLLR
jgi:hypothetical protein